MFNRLYLSLGKAGANAACSYWCNLGSVQQVPIAAGWNEAVWNTKSAWHFYTWPALGIEPQIFWSWVQCPIHLAMCHHEEGKMEKDTQTSDYFFYFHTMRGRCRSCRERKGRGGIEKGRDVEAKKKGKEKEWTKWEVLFCWTLHCIFRWVINYLMKQCCKIWFFKNWKITLYIWTLQTCWALPCPWVSKPRLNCMSWVIICW